MSVTTPIAFPVSSSLPVAPAMIPAVAIVIPIVGNSPLANWMIDRSAASGVDLQIKIVTADTRSEYKPAFHAFDNVISWGFRMPHQWMTKEGKNVLFIENGLLNQRAGVFVDHRGLFSQSNLCRNQEWQYATPDLGRLQRTADQLKGRLGNWFDRSGPALLALQCKADATMIYEYPLADGQTAVRGSASEALDRIEFTIETVRQHLPITTPVVVRPHPREPNALAGIKLPPNWTVQSTGTIAEAIRQSSCLIAVNSTCVSEGALFGIPTAVLGTGVFTGCPAFLDCSQTPTLLRKLPTFDPDLKWQLAYASAILEEHQMPYNAQNVPTREFDAWLATAISLHSRQSSLQSAQG